jgi:uncharacterized protein (UPF0303 family)
MRPQLAMLSRHLRARTGAGTGASVHYVGRMTADLARIDEQLRRLRFTGFDETDAWELGADLRRRAADRDVAVTIEIRIAGSTVFMCAMAGTAPANADWARRKRNVVELLHQPSYAVGLEEIRDGRSVLAQMGRPDHEVASHGGSFPIIVDGVGCIGAVTVSGLPQRDDHELVVEALAARCGVEVADVRLD